MKIDYIEGPVTVYCLRRKGTDTTYWIFGDQHQLTDGCSDDKTCMRGRVARLEQFISEEALAHPERTLHVLLETWPLDRLDETQVRSYDTRSYLQMLSHFFASSLLKDPCQTYYPNVRVHGIDARQSSTAFQGIMDTARDADHLTKEQIDNCIKCLEVYREDKNVEGLINYHLRSSGVLERIEALRSQDHRRLCSGVLRRHHTTRRFYETPIGDIIQALEDMDQAVVSAFLSTFMREALKVMDADALSVLLTADRAVVFVGLEHAEKYMKLLNRVGFECVWPDKNQRRTGRMRQCIDFRQAPTPYF
jgi:hypothetical protein